MQRVQLAAFVVAVSSAVCFADSPKTTVQSDDKLEVGKHYCVVVREVEGDEAVTTTYWAIVTKADDQRIVLADGEWNQSTGPVVKPQVPALIRLVEQVFLSIDRVRGRKPLVAILGGIPMAEDTVVLMRNQITKIRPMSETEVELRKEAHRVTYPRPPHVAGAPAGEGYAN